MPGGGGDIIWAAFYATGKSSIKFIDDTLNSVRYLNMLKNRLELFIVAKRDFDCWF